MTLSTVDYYYYYRESTNDSHLWIVNYRWFSTLSIFLPKTIDSKCFESFASLDLGHSSRLMERPHWLQCDDKSSGCPSPEDLKLSETPAAATAKKGQSRFRASHGKQ